MIDFLQNEFHITRINNVVNVEMHSETSPGYAMSFYQLLRSAEKAA